MNRGIMIVTIFAFFTATSWQPDPYKGKREEMVRSQLIPRGITSKELLAAFKKVPRHLFVPPAYLPQAYNDQPLPIGEGQTISQPYIVAYMTEVLNIKPGEKVLEIGTGSGYQAAILVTCSPSDIPVPLKTQLAEGGRMIIPVGDPDWIQFLYYLEKKNGKIRQKNVMAVRFVPMTDVKGTKY